MRKEVGHSPKQTSTPVLHGTTCNNTHPAEVKFGWLVDLCAYHRWPTSALPVNAIRKKRILISQQTNLPSDHLAEHAGPNLLSKSLRGPPRAAEARPVPPLTRL